MFRFVRLLQPRRFFLYENAEDPLLWLYELCGTPLLPAITLLGSNTPEHIPPLWLGFCTVN